jgi:dTDP-4-amino-4,6-dideoxy-D-galactose acyltransferase
MAKGAYCKVLPWDTDFFGYKIAQVSVHRLEEQKLTHMLDWCRKNKIDCVYFLADSEDGKSIRLAEDWGFRLVDIRMTFEYNVSNTHTSESKISNHEYPVRPYQQGDISSLERIARDCYHDTRFYYDPCFSDDACRKLYATWIKRSCEGYADHVLVAEEKGVTIGYISCHLNHASAVGQIGLFGVDRQVRGRKAGKMLLLNSLKWFAEQGIVKIKVVTQGRNVAAQRFYERCGFYTKRVQIWYHKWFAFCEVEKGQ